MAWNIVLIDDHRLFREGLCSMLALQPDLKVAGQAGDAHEAYTVVDAVHPDVVVLDVALPGANGISVARELMRRDARTKVLMLSMYLDEEHVAQALSAGVLGYAGKDQAAGEVVAAIRQVAQGGSYLSPRISRFVVEEYQRIKRGGSSADEPLAPLTAREREIFDLTVRGLSNREVASQLFISPRTVETHRSRIMRKLGAHSASDLVRLAARHGLLLDGATAPPRSSNGT